MSLQLLMIDPPQRVLGTRKDQRRAACHVLLQVAVSRRHQDADRKFGTHLLNRFHSSRYPTKPADTAHKFTAAENNHIVFVRKNKFFEVPLTHNGVDLSEAELQLYVFVYPSLATHHLTLQLPGKLNESSSWLETNLAYQLVSLLVKIVTFGPR